MTNWKAMELDVERVGSQVEGVEFGDARLNDRFAMSVELQARAPDEAYPEIFGDGKFLEGFYRFVNNDKVTMQKAMEPQFEQTAENCRDEQKVFVLHDTTDYSLGGETRREGVGRINEKDQGFLAHYSLAVKADETREPLGLLDTQVWTRRPDEGKDPYEVEPMWERFEESESEKWGRGVDRTRQRLGETSPEVIHVMDSDADDYALWSKLKQSNQRFIIRSCVLNRRLMRSPSWSAKNIEAPNIQNAMDDAEVVSERTIWLSPRGRKGRSGAAKRKHPPREGRWAEIEIRRMPIEVRRPAQQSDKLPEQLSLHLVVAIEPEPPEGKEPVEWALVTTEPIETAEQAEEVVDGYQGRWVIEELNKATKSGCNYEERQFESSHAMLNVLAQTLPIAVDLLRIRTVSHYAPEISADHILSPAQQQILAANRKTDYQMDATVEQALKAVAQLGGFLSRNGKPGWLTLMRGMKKLHTLEHGFQVASQSQPSQAHEAEVSSATQNSTS